MIDHHEQWTTLHTAAKTGDAQTCQQLLASNADPAPKTKLQWTPLHFAARGGHTDCCRILLDAGAPMDTTAKIRGYMPIHLAALAGHTETVAFFIERGARIDSLTVEGWTPLHSAIEHAHRETALFLIEHGADPNLAKRAKKAVFPLHTAVQNGRADLVQLLLDAGANPYVVDKHGKSPYDYAKKYKFAHLLEILPDQGPLGELVQNPEELRVLVCTGHEEELEAWLAEGNDVNIANNMGQTLLHFAVLESNLSAVEILLRHGALPNRKIVSLGNALDIACCMTISVHPRETEEIIKLLIKYGANISQFGNIRDGIKCGGYLSPAVNQLLEQSGFDLDEQTRRDAILRWAVACGDCLEAEKQLRAKADPNMSKRTCGSVFPLEQAVFYNRDVTMTNLLIRYGAKVNRRTGLCNSLLYSAAENGDLEIVKLLVEGGAKVNRKDMFGETPLYAALDGGHRHVADYLIERGAAIDAQAKSFLGITLEVAFSPLFAAAKSGDLQSVQLFAQAGVDLSVVGEGGLTPLHAAAQNGHTHVVSFLLDQNVDLNAKDWDGNTPLHLAGMEGHAQTAAVLIEHGADVTDVPANFPTLSWYVLLDRLDLLKEACQQTRHKGRDASNDLQALKTAIDRDRFDMVQEMLEQGIRPIGILSYAASENKLSFVLLVLHYGAHANECPRETVPPLHSSASVEIARVLLEHGANVYLRSFCRELALDIAMERQCAPLAAFLRQVMMKEDGSRT
ncbi:MAG: ankyrin repeat domain-containing protein [Thermoguttaceae bacterium]|nr:ankyrin repeat domain-containing protein [Thermoguttaceae bacterium]